MRRKLSVLLVLVSAVVACPPAPPPPPPPGPTASIAPTDVDVGTVNATVKNTRCPQGSASRNMTLTVNTPNPVGYLLAMSPGDFRWDPDTTLPNPFPAGASTYTVPIVFTPHHTGDHKAVASMILNDPKANPVNIVDLKGKGVCEF